MKHNSKNLLYILIGVIVVLIAAVIFFIHRSNEKAAEVAAVANMMQFEKQQVERQFQDVSTEFDGYNRTTIHNDSLFKLLDNQKMKVQQLLEELRITKATDAKKIFELKQELSTVRTIMIHYVTQIDSLNTENKHLRTENREVKRKYRAVSATVKQLSKEKQNMTEVINRASRLEIANFKFEKLNSRNHRAYWTSQIATLEFDYTILKNITTDPGYKTLYLRITRPDGEVLSKSLNNTFQYENKQIAYSAKKDFDYTGQEMNDVIYWKVEEIIQRGTYRADFFIDGDLCGSYNFVIRK